MNGSLSSRSSLATLTTSPEILDDTLRKVNSDYDAKRFHDLALEGPKIHSVASGTFYNWMKKRGKLGVRTKCLDEQFEGICGRDTVHDLKMQINPLNRLSGLTAIQA